MVKQSETNVDDVNFCKTTQHMKYSMEPLSATIQCIVHCAKPVKQIKWKSMETIYN